MDTRDKALLEVIVKIARATIEDIKDRPTATIAGADIIAVARLTLADYDITPKHKHYNEFLINTISRCLVDAVIA